MHKDYICRYIIIDNLATDTWKWIFIYPMELMSECGTGARVCVANRVTDIVGGAGVTPGQVGVSGCEMTGQLVETGNAGMKN